MYSSLSDAVLSMNKFLYCDIGTPDSAETELAFGKCGPTAAVLDNAIGKDGYSLLQTYIFEVLELTRWSDLACTEAIFSVNSGLPATASLDSSNGELSALAAFTATMTFAVEVNGLIAISNPVTLESFDCTPFVTFSSLPPEFKGQINSVFVAIVISATSSSPDCVIGSFSLNSDSNSASLSSDGAYSLDTSVASKFAMSTVSVAVGSQTVVSSPFGSEVYDCNQHITFPNLTAEIIG